MKDILVSILDECSRKYSPQFADIRVFKRVGSSIVIENGRAFRMYEYRLHGGCVRVLIDGAWGFSAINDTSKEGLRRAMETAAKMAIAASKRVTEKRGVAEIRGIEDSVVFPVKIKPEDIPIDQKVKELLEVEKVARKYHPNIVNTILSYGDRHEIEIVANTLGTYTEQDIPRTGIGLLVVTREAGVVQRTHEDTRGIKGYEVLKEFLDEEKHIRAATTAVDLLKARPPPAGKFKAILSPEVTGLIVHEAFGHNREADAVIAGESILEGKVGEKVASELVTMVDDSTIPGAYGSFKYDSEGTPGRKRVIVEKGILRGFLHSLETAKKLEARPTGSARADTHHNIPIVRMSNTYIDAGNWTFEEMLEDIDHGIYFKKSQWGYVFPEKGQFTCNVIVSYMIRKGEVAEMLRDVSFGGLTLETLKMVDAVGRDLVIPMAGMCGKGGQGAPVCCGGPHIRVKEVVVGGRA